LLIEGSPNERSAINNQQSTMSPCPNDSHHASRLFFRGPVRVEHVRERSRAQPGDMDLRRRNTSGFELIAISERQIEV